MGVHIFKHLIYFPKVNPHFQISMKVLCLVLLIAVAAQAENCQVYKNGIESIFSKMPAVNSASDPNDGVCEDGEGWGCIAEIASETFTFSSSFQLLMIGMICNHFSDS